MAHSTEELELFKYDEVADAGQVFSFEQALNDNWDKIDSFAGAIKSLSNLDAQGEKRFSDIWTELDKKLEAEVLLSENGYIKFNNGLLIQFGIYGTAYKVPDGTTCTIIFGIGFTSTPWQTLCQNFITSTDVTAGIITIPWDWVTPTQFSFMVFSRDSGYPNSPSIYWIAIGY